MYMEMATEEDKKLVEDWKADADGILIFVRLYPLIWCFTLTEWLQTGLFSAAVASLISVSIQDIRQNPQDTSNFYLANIYQATINPNVSESLPTSPPPFSPPNYAVWVNALWFMTLVISLTCALLATLLQQWARRYLKVTQTRYSPHKRARIRSFFSEGVEKCLLPWAVETLPTLLHIALFLFFAGLVVFLCNVDMTIFKLVLSWVGVCTALYGCITLMPIFRHDSPYRTPLSLPAWHIVTGISHLSFRALRRVTQSEYFSQQVYNRFYFLKEHYRKILAHGMQKTAEETALNSSSDIDTRAFMWTFDCLDEDHELERFFSGFPGLRSSKVVTDPLPSLTSEQNRKVCEALTGLLDRTFSSDLLLAPVKTRRALICAKAVHPAHISGVFFVIDRILSEYEYRGPVAAGVVNILRGWANDMDARDVFEARAVISMTVARVQPHDDAWYILASNALGVTEATLRSYSAHGDSLSLSILIHVVRLFFTHFRNIWQYDFSKVLAAASAFDVQDTSPELQHEFCALWNQIVRQVQTGNYSMAFNILRMIRNVYLALHNGTDCAPTRFSPSTGDNDHILLQLSSYPLCNIPTHHLDSTSHIHDDSASTASVLTVPLDHDNTAHIPSPLASPDPLPLSPNLPLSTDDILTDAPSLENNISVPVFLQPVHQPITESRRISAISSNPATTHATHGITDTSPRLTCQSTPELSTSTCPKSKASNFLPSAIAAEHTAIKLTPSGGLDVASSPDVLSSASREPVVDHISGPSLSLTLP